jgi:hypothetical protein
MHFFEKHSNSTCHAPALQVSASVIKILQSYYPERLHRAYWWHAPAAFRGVYATVKPFLERKTREKIVSLPKGDAASQERLNSMCEPCHAFEDAFVIFCIEQCNFWIDCTLEWLATSSGHEHTQVMCNKAPH